ncbi:adenosylcobinamide-phosphate synthase CbiB [Aminipila luticellarii]|uniref:Cobalamin biosynthesis protein CobD n=1 Tax=Aminipila luticellarii TaxID=2507160 RepID=A0A410PVH7_9FIRM|nr:adenosylcobinamide-phosphate synthase CbiB [Aminipila luticellarii]QAT42910.1 cobalamin biosynthesis protein CobD [Aminipila luticellarii]
MNPILIAVLPLFLGFILDLLIGDPHNWPHPIRLIGNTIDKFEQFFRHFSSKTRGGEFRAGMLMAFCILVLSFFVPAVLLGIAYKIHWIAGVVIETVMCYQILAVKALKTESMNVYKELEKNDLEGARQKVSMIVGRDTENLTEEGIIKAAVETVAENTSDGTVAPMIFMAIGGAPLGFLYKAVNTMDSMIGYKNDKYLYFGRFAAKLDDVLNFIPARLSGMFMIIAALFCGLDFKNAARIYRRDRLNHASPNSAHTEAVCAGALRIQLAGNAYYFGKLYEKKTIGDDTRPVNKEDIILSNRLLYGTAWIALIVCMLGMVVVRWLI